MKGWCQKDGKDGARYQDLGINKMVPGIKIIGE
jgi:hypothetical protein